VRAFAARSPSLLVGYPARYHPYVRRTSLGLVLWLGLLPFIVGAAPDATQDADLPAAVPVVCPGIPAGAPLIQGLVSGQVLTSGNAVTLQFSNVSFACGSWLNEITSQGCHDDWEFSLTLPVGVLHPGVYDLAALSAQFGELYDIAGPSESEGCSRVPCTMSVKGIGTLGVTDPGATLAIYSADAQCVTGTISGLTDTFSDAPDHNGAFFALPCAE
jgi:hypothetical protein